MISNPPDSVIDFKANQQAFAGYIRNPEHSPAPADVKPQRMAMYRELFFNNVESFISSNFPVLKSLLTEQQWLDLAQDFFLNHRCTTPHFSEIPEEFLEFLQNERDNKDDFPFMLELAHYEWVEMALAIAKDELIENDSKQIQPENNIALSSLAWPLAYRYPVHEISTENIPVEAPDGMTFLIVYRDSEDNVNFIKIPDITFRLLQIIQETENISVADCLSQIAKETQQTDSTNIINSGMQILQELADKNIIYLSTMA